VLDKTETQEDVPVVEKEEIMEELALHEEKRTEKKMSK